MALTSHLDDNEPIKILDEEEERRERAFRAARAANDRKAYNRFLDIFDKYARDFDGIGDEIDLVTGKIVVNNGHIQGMKDETDIGADLEDDEYEQVDTRKRFVRALTVEPELVVLSDSEEDAAMEADESEEDEIKCEDCWEADERHCPHVQPNEEEVPKKAPTKTPLKPPKTDIPSAALDHSRLRQFGEQLSVRKPKLFKLHPQDQAPGSADLQREARSSSVESEDPLPSAVAFEVLMNSTVASASSVPKPAPSSTSSKPSKGAVLVSRPGHAEKPGPVKPHNKMIHVFRLSEGKSRQRKRKRPTAKEQTPRTTAAVNPIVLSEDEISMGVMQSVPTTQQHDVTS